MIYFCPTPIGNMGDITLRTLEVLNKVDYIFAEDTRVTLKLLNHYDIHKKLESYHKFNERMESSRILTLLKKGHDIALVTDAGMPGISDPGSILIEELIKADMDFQVLPGANAALTALVQSGLPTEHFYFYGFLPTKSGERKKALENLSQIRDTLIFYESPHRITRTVKEVLEVFGNRRASISRELTKLFEECIRGSLEELTKKEIITKGEFVLVVEGNLEEVEYDIAALLQKEINKGLTKSQAVKVVSSTYDLPKNDVYKESLKIHV
ncbi:MAG: 16S rRNA (cytidine(1402)-2'-O)-methyltransferase [Tissierellia bacterium]|nr:16S rRNA (cytidine(1402)-2'-O)-methyltransferase [Tissierellia bacterium]